VDRLITLLARWRHIERRSTAKLKLSAVPLRAVGLVVFALVVVALAADFVYLHTRSGMIPNDDVFAYECYARAFWRGPAALHDSTLMRYCADHRWLFWTAPPRVLHTLPREYPAPAVLWFSLPLLWPGSTYPVTYMVLVALVVAGTVAIFIRRGLLLCAVACAAYVLIGGWGTTLERYDIIPGVLVLGALVLAERSRYVPAYVLLAVSALLKVYPGFVVPILAAHQWRTSGKPPFREIAAFLLTVCAGALPFALLSPSGFAAPLRYNAQRPPQIESIAGSLLWLSGKIGGNVRVRLTYHSVNVYGMFSGFAASLATGLLLTGVLLVAWRTWSGRAELRTSVVQVLLVILCTSKLLSPQYLLWLFPVVAYVDGLRLRWLVVAALTLVIIPYGYGLDHSLVLLPRHPLFMEAILTRNAVLLAILFAYRFPAIVPARRWPADSAVEAARPAP
jgi:hypothetical protein